MALYLILISSAPGTKNFDRAFTLVENIKANDNSVNLFFIQDGIRAAIDGNKLNKKDFDRIINSGVKCYVLDEDLRLRGFEKGMLMPEIIPSGYNELVELMAAEGVSTLGVF